MKKLLYTALGLIGIMGTLSMGVVSAKSETIYITGFTASAANQLIQTNNQVWDDLELYFLESDGTTGHYTIMDRNMGASEVYNQNQSSPNTNSYGYHYQWGNKYGFTPGCFTNACEDGLPQGQNVNASQTSGFDSMPSKFARNQWSSSRQNLKGNNLWGGGGDTNGSNHDGILIGNNNNLDILSGRQGPCPEGYYVPSAYDWVTLTNAWSNSSSGTQNTIWIRFASDLLLPPAGDRAGGRWIEFPGTNGLYWSSSPRSNDKGYMLSFGTISSFGVDGDGHSRAYGHSVRCAKGTPNTGFTIHSNGGVKAVIAFTGEAGSGNFTALGTPMRGNDVFDGWYTNDGRLSNDWGDKLVTGSTVVTDIYAKWHCADNYYDNGTGCVPIMHTVTLDCTTNGGTCDTGSAEVISGGIFSGYTATKTDWDFVGWNTNSGANEGMVNPTVTGDMTLYAIFKKVLTAEYTATNANIPGNQASGSCTLWNNDTSCSIPLPAAITCNAGYHSPIWTPANLDDLTDGTPATASCTQCEAGTYTTQGNTATSCTQCEAGYYCQAGAAKAECTGRTQYSETGASACSTVSEGYYTVGCAGNNKCTGQSQCTAGTACSGGVQTSCVASTNTVAGTYSNSDGATSCTTADDGYYTTSANATGQTQCPAGSYCPGGKLISCPAGTTSVAGSTSESACKITCNAGEYLPKNTSSCQSCPAGKYCAGGEYGFSSSNDQGIGGDCNADTYSVGGASVATCTACPSGYKSAAGATGQTACYIEVPAGQYLGTADGTGTTACASGTYKEAHQVNYGETSSCTACPSGYTSEDGATICYISVPAGQYLGTTGGTATTACASGTYKGAHNVNYGETSSCTTCGAGYYCPAGAGAGTACPSGYTSPEGASEENQCYQNKPSGGSSSGGGGSSRSSSKNDTSKDDNTASNSQTDSQKDSNTQNASESQDSTNDTSERQNNSEGTQKTYSDEFQQAYEFAYKNGITTMSTIQKADMEGGLTRIAMAKMLSYYAINLLGMKPDESRINKFNDVTDELDAQYDSGVTLAYQLGIMGINMPGNNFRPNDEVTRAEFATALSRLIYSTSDGEYELTPKYYIHHMEKLMEEKILTNDDPMMKELRGYVMIMLMRSAK